MKALSPTFFLVGGIILVVAGVAQVLVRPRAPDETPVQKLINRATVQMMVFLSVGVLGILVGAGVLPVRFGP